MTITLTRTDDFFDRYATALLDRDAAALAELYAVPALILFPSNSIAVTDIAQTEAFFASSWERYDGVTDVDRELTIIAQAPTCIWADVTWTYSGGPSERFCYQLTDTDGELQIAVLTPMTTP